MLANKSFSIFVIVAAFLLLATVQAVPTTNAAEAAEPTACISCPAWPDCTRRCPPGHWCDFNRCACTQVCRPGQIP
ncbi:hypothetical protein BGZ59_000526 [Podila verticillata]|nr:hypothetical protein BGZ59_000526 [Podila verticillata]